MPARRSRIPARRVTLLGREEEVVLVRDLVLNADTRLVTLLGGGGSGKTTLALEVARDVEALFPDGASLVDLTAVRDPQAVAVSCCELLGILDHSLPPGEALEAHLAPRQALLVLDSCEHLLPDLAGLVDQLLDACPDLRVLVTSRIRLQMRDERVVPVPPLRVPGPSDRDAEVLAVIPSVELFVRHATASDPTFVLDAWAPVVASICRQLDGVPLAIELAAAQASALTPTEIAARLSRGPENRPADDGSDRRRTMDATLDWSHALLAAPQQALFRRLSVFAGGWTLEAAEAVCSIEGEPWEVAPTLVTLVEHSLVVRENVGGRGRFRMLAPVAEYARRRLAESDEAGPISVAHAHHHLRLVGGGSADFRRAEPEHLDLISDEYENISAALRFAEQAGIVPLVIGFDVSLLLYWRIRGLLRSGLSRLDGAAELVGEEASPERGFVLAGRAHFGQLLGDLGPAEAAGAEAEAVFEAVGEVVGLRTVIGFRGDIALDRGDVAGAREHYARARALVGPDDALDLGFWHANVGRAAVRAGELDTAERELDRALVHLAEAPGWYRGHVLVQLGSLARRRGDVGRARTLLLEALGHLRRYRATLEAVSCLEELGRLALDLRDHDHAATVFAAATGLRDAVGLRLTGDDRAAAGVDLDAVREALAPEVFARAWQAGLGLSLDDAVAFASSAPGEVVTLRARRRGADLTPREHEIALLVARGLTNRQIAEGLHIAPGTVRIHVERILGKLGLTSRVQVATWVARQQVRA